MVNGILCKKVYDKEIQVSRLFFAVFYFVMICTCSLFSISIRYAEISYRDVVEKSYLMLQQHPSFEQVNEELACRTLERYLFELDPMKLFFVASEIAPWSSPDQKMLKEIIMEFLHGQFDQFEKLFDLRIDALKRYNVLEKQARALPKPEHVCAEKIKEFDWATDDSQLMLRLKMIQTLEENSLAQFEPSVRKMALDRFEKRKKFLLDMDLVNRPAEKKKIIATLILKAFAQALDSQTAYFTPAEANQFIIAVQQRLFGLGVLLRDDIDGFTIMEIVPGGAAARQGKLQVNDKIIAVDKVPVIGLDVFEVVEMIRGKENTYVTLRVIKGFKEGQKVDATSQKTTFDLTLRRAEVVVQENRITSKVLLPKEGCSYGPIGYIHLNSFYQDESTSSYEDIRSALLSMMKKQHLEGVILDLRGNPGGILQQAVDVCGLFMDRALICSVKEAEAIYPFWNSRTKKLWDGPLVILTDRSSASASEIVAQSLQDWKRAIVIGDDRTFGKGSYQMLSFPADGTASVNPKGEFKISKGRYYTASGRSPQLVGVHPNVEVSSWIRFAQVGEEFSHYPLSTDQIPSFFENGALFEERISSLGALKEGVKNIFSSAKLQMSNGLDSSVLAILKKRSQERLQKNDTYQSFCRYLQSKNTYTDLSEEDKKKFDQDFTLDEAIQVIYDLEQVNQEKSLPKAA